MPRQPESEPPKTQDMEIITDIAAVVHEALADIAQGEANAPRRGEGEETTDAEVGDDTGTSAPSDNQAA